MSIASKHFFMQNMQIRQPLPKIDFQAISQKPIDFESQMKCLHYGFHGQLLQMLYIFFSSV